MFTYLFPLLHGPPGTEISGVRNYVGLIGFFLAAIAVVAVLGKQPGNDRTIQATDLVLFLFTVLLELKRYGFAPVNAIGRLPFFSWSTFRSTAKRLSRYASRYWVRSASKGCYGARCPRVRKRSARRRRLF